MSDLIKFKPRKELAPEILFAEANRKLNANERLDEVLDMLFQISKDYPHFGKVYNHLGWIYETKFKDFIKAEENYQKALELAPDYPAVYENYLSVLERMNKLDKMKEILDLALKSELSNKTAIHEFYGRYYELKGEYDLAIREYRSSIESCFSMQIISDLKDCIKRCHEKSQFLNNEESF